MSTTPQRDPLEIDEQSTRIRAMTADIDKRRVEVQKITQDIKLATPQMIFQGALAMAVIIGAGAALAKLFS